VAGAVISALADADTPVWLDPSMAKTGVVRDWVVFHTGAPVTTLTSQRRLCAGGSAAEPVVTEWFCLGDAGLSGPLDNIDPAGRDAFKRA
jgi:alpha-D-ribose 1-methylphosphonate 5-triphosphate synthase subunit PhnH